MFGQDHNVDPEMPVHISVYSVLDCLKLMGITNVNVVKVINQLPPETEQLLLSTIKSLGMTQNINETATDILTQDYLVHIING